MMFQHSPQQPLKFGSKPTMAPSTQATNTDSTDDKLFRQPITFDGKRMRKAVMRKTVDYNSSVVKQIENRKWFKDLGKRNGMQPDDSFSSDVYPPACMIDNPINAVTTKFVRTSTNKLRCPIFCVAWTPEGRRLVTGASSGEFTLWNGLTFNFETILQAHDSPVRSMVWSHSDNWLLSSDHGGFIKYWQSNMNNVKMYEAHKEPIRGLSFAPTDNKFASCSDDGFVKIWDFYRCAEERILKGHGADVKCVDWHPTKSLVVSGSKDSQQPIKLWDPRTGTGLTTLHAHKSTVMQIKWNQNGNWLLTASRDHLLKLFDIRMMKELQTFRGHKREATAISWHPIHESLFVSGGSDGAIMFWVAGAEKDVGNMDMAHEGMVWSLAWHPLGHILCSGSNDHSSKFWTRNRLGDKMRDKYNLNILDTEDDADGDHPGVVMTGIPGMDTALNPAEDFPDIDRYDLGEKGPGLGVGSSPANRSTPPRPRPSEPLQNPGFNLPNIKASPQIPGLGSLDTVTSGNEPGNSALRPDAPPFEPGRPGERSHNGPFEPPQPQRFPRPDNFRLEPGRRGEPVEQSRRPFDGPAGEHSTLPPAHPRNDFGRDQWNEPRGPPGDFKRPNWHEQGPNDFERRDRLDDHRPLGPDFRGPLGDRFFGPPSERMGLLGSPPRNPDADTRPGLLGPPPVQQPPQHLGPGLQGVPGARPSLLGAPPANDFLPHGTVPNNNSGGEHRHDQEPWRPPNEREMERSKLSPRFEMGDPHTRHPNDLSSRGFRRGTTRGHHRGHNSASRHDLDQAEPKPPYTYPFLNKHSSRGSRAGTQGQHGMHLENRDPRRAANTDESQQVRGPEDPRGPRFGGWGSSQEDMNWGQSPGHDTRGPQRDEPRDPRMMRGPLGPPGQEQNLSMSEAPKGANDTKPAIRPLMSISPPPLPMGHSSFDFDLGDSWKGAPDRRGRKRSGEQEGFREADREKAPDRGPPKSVRQEEDWRRGPDQGPPSEGWRGPRGGDPEERFKEEFPRGEFGAASEGEGGPRGRGKPRGGRRGRGGRR